MTCDILDPCFMKWRTAWQYHPKCSNCDDHINAGERYLYIVGFLKGIHTYKLCNTCGNTLEVAGEYFRQQYIKTCIAYPEDGPPIVGHLQWLQEEMELEEQECKGRFWPNFYRATKSDKQFEIVRREVVGEPRPLKRIVMKGRIT